MQKCFNKKDNVNNKITAIYSPDLNLIEENRNFDPERKHSILTRLKELSHNRYAIARKHLPKALGVSKSTFDKWIYLKYNQPNQIPLDKIAAIANFFDIRIESLMNEPIRVLDNKTLKYLSEEKLKRDFGII